MPAALLTPLIASATGLTGTALSVTTGIAQLTLVAGLSGLSMLLAPKPELEDPSNGQLETQQSVPSRTFVYGRMEVSGSVGMKKKAGNETSPALYKILLIHDGEIDAWETIYGDDRVCTLDPTTGFVTNGPFHQAGVDRLQIFLHNGTDSQAADAELLAQAALDKLYWTTEHRLRGIAYAVIIAHGVDSDNYLQAYPHGEPQFKFVIRGRRLWDPRDSAQDPDDPATWLWSDNPALAILDWAALHPKGYASVGVTLAKLDIDSFVEMADLCDELVPLAEGTSERRYRVAMEANLRDQTRNDILSRLRQSCDAHLFKTGAGLWAIRGGNWTAPTVTLDTEAGHILDAEMKDGVEATSRFNEYSVTYLEPNNHYAENECDPWQMVGNIEFDAGKVKTSSLALTQVPSFSQARRLTKIYASYSNPDWLGTIRTNFFGLNVIGERNITLNWSEPEEAGADIDGAYWLEQSMTLNSDGTGMALSVRSCDPTAYDWTTAEEGTPPKILPPSESVDKFTDGTPPPNPTDFAATGAATHTNLQWTAGASEAFYIARIWRATTTSFANAIEVSGPRYRERKDTTPTLMTFRDELRAGSYRYWLTVENQVGDRNTPVGPLTVTVT